MAKRSPILGYNHNIRHRGLIFHVQTEDSGLSNPHIFTHLFHGGIIVSTRKLVYDPEAADEVVKSLMQAQHRAVLKDLKEGKFTDKINQYLGKHPDLLPFEPGGNGATTEPVTRVTFDEVAAPEPAAAPARAAHDTEVTPLPVTDEVTEPVVLLRAEDTKRDKPPLRSRPPTGEVAQIHSPAPPSAPEPPGLERGGTYSHHRKSGPIPTRPGDKPAAAAAPPVTPPSAPVPRPPTTPPPRGGRPGSVPSGSPAGKSGGVVVSRPAVIVGAPPRVVGGSPGTRDTQRRGKTEIGGPAGRKPDTLFGQGLISEKSLDEVILAYLSEDGDEE